VKASFAFEHLNNLSHGFGELRRTQSALRFSLYLNLFICLFLASTNTAQSLMIAIMSIFFNAAIIRYMSVAQTILMIAFPGTIKDMFHQLKVKSRYN
jgi:hypothetical protein